MPNDVKAVLSVIALIVAAAFAYYETTIGNDHLVWVVLGTGVFMVAAMWVFPEAGSKKKKNG
ncbi:MAG: hypothetical protein ACR2PO_01705 [Methyloligellaceae bacterium]